MEDITPPFLGVSKARPILQCVVKGTQLPSRKGPVGSTDLDENHPRSIINPPTISLFRDLIADENGAKILFENYLERVITQYPIYHRTDVTTAFNSIYPQKPSKSGDDSVRNQYIVCMIMAISLSTHARKNVVKANQQAFQLVRCAMQWIPKVATNDIAGLQAILLLTQYIFLNPSMADLWLLTGLISQSVIDLGLHQELPNDEKISEYDRDMRRRLFWCAWEMEVGVCSIFLYPTSLPIKDIQVQFPLEIDDTAITQHGTVPEGRVSKFTQRIICSFRLIEAEFVSIMWHKEPIPTQFDSVESWSQDCIDRMHQWQREIYAAAHANQDPGLFARWEEMMLYSDIAVFGHCRPLRVFHAQPTIKTVAASHYGTTSHRNDASCQNHCWISQAVRGGSWKDQVRLSSVPSRLPLRHRFLGRPTILQTGSLNDLLLGASRGVNERVRRVFPLHS